MFRRPFLLLLLLSIAFLTLGTLGQLLLNPIYAQIEEEEIEEEEVTPREQEAGNPPKIVRRVEVEDPPENALDIDIPQLSDLRLAAKVVKHPGIRELFRSLGVPHDVLVYTGINGLASRIIKPISPYLGENPKKYSSDIAIQMLDQDWNVADSKLWSPNSMNAVQHYEEIALKKVEAFLKQPFERLPKQDRRYLTPKEKLIAAEQVLNNIQAYHQSARTRGKRTGDAWEDVTEKLRTALRDVVIERLKLFIEAGDWTNAFALAKQTSKRFPQLEDQRKIAAPMAELVKKLLTSGIQDEKTFRETHKRLRALQEEFPNARSFTPITDRLKRQAKKMFERAQALVKDNKLTEARTLLTQAEEIWPAFPGLRNYRLQVSRKYPVLNVGVQRLPKYLSPARAVIESEKQAVELLFESLIELSSDPKSIRYDSVLAQGRPRPTYLGRKFRISSGTFWSNGEPLTSLDVSNTLQLLSKPDFIGHDPGWSNDLIKEARVSGPFQLTLTLRQGYLDPLALMTFKVLPNFIPSPDHLDFAMSPIGSGPYQAVKETKQLNGIEYKQFLANSYFSRRYHGEVRRNMGLPRIREIRFFKTVDPAKELAEGKLDLVLDLTSEQAKAATEKSRDVFVPKPIANRRVYFLALNQHSDQYLKNRDFRRAIALAIDRDAILNKHFRKGNKEAHHPLNGPYPVHSWAYNEKIPRTLHDATAAKQHLNLAEKKVPINKAKEWILKYPVGETRDLSPRDIELGKAMETLAGQLTNALGIKVKATPLEEHQLQSDVFNHNYSLAYFYHDYPNHICSVRPLLDSRSTKRRGMNYLGYTNGEMEQDLREAMSHRNFAKVREVANDIHRRFQQEMPFVPLWQLDRFIGIHRHLEMRDQHDKLDYTISEDFPIDPLRIFANVEYWRLNRD